MRKFRLLVLIIMLAACNLPSNLPAPAQPDALTTAAPTTTNPPSTATSIPHTTVDVSTMQGKLMMGYQGWFNCPGDGAGVDWFHWFRNSNNPSAASLRVDMWPDSREMPPDPHCKTAMKYPNEETAYLYSAYNPDAVMMHFRWMSEYGVDGVFLQRFGSELGDPRFFNQRNVVTKNVRAGAETYGRAFAIMYDTGGMSDDTYVADLEKDWKYLVDTLKVTESSSYLHHNGKPIVAIWGLGLIEHPGTPQQAMELVDFFENNPDPTYQATVMGGVATSWRLLKNDALTDPGWADYYCSLSVISPWTVGRYSTDAEVDQYKTFMQADMEKAEECGAQYMPVVYPGTAFHNDSGTPFNSIPRRGGDLYWRQIYNAVSLGVPMIYNAMFDEVDEDTAMYKIAATANDQPVGVDLVSMDADGIKLPNDWYLRLAGAATKMLRGEIPLTDQVPLHPDGSLVTTFPTLVPTPQLFKIRIQMITTSDWTTLSLVSGGRWHAPQVVSSSPEANASADVSLFGLGQPLARAEAGKPVEMVVDVALSDIQIGQTLTFLIRRGSIGKTTIMLMNALGAEPIIVKTIEWKNMSGSTGENPFEFTIETDLFMASK